jgi:tetratricopeptide (TPR) repeat protein
MFAAMTMFDALKQLKLKYLKDPVSPFRSRNLDYVQYPRETLGYRTGDCDDLAVLYAALLESVGVQTAFITTPGHILTAFKIEPGSGLMSMAHDPSLYIQAERTPARPEGKAGVRGTCFRVDAGRDKSSLVRLGSQAKKREIWVPVETTSLDRSFVEAWRRGAREVAKWKKKKGKLSMISVQHAWKSFPAVSLPQDIKDVQVDPAALEKQLVKDSKEFVGLVKKGYQKSLASLKKRVARNKKNLSLRNDYAVLLASGGKLEEAAAQLSSAIKINPKHACSLNNLANVHLLSGEFKKAVDLYKKALDNDKKNAGRIYANVGLAYYSFGKKSQAEEAFIQSARLGGGELFESMGLTPPREAAGTLGSEKKKRTKEVIERDLEKLLEEVLSKADKEKAKKAPAGKTDLFSNPLPSGGRRGDDPASRRRLVELLRWF